MKKIYPIGSALVTVLLLTGCSTSLPPQKPASAPTANDSAISETQKISTSTSAVIPPDSIDEILLVNILQKRLKEKGYTLKTIKYSPYLGGFEPVPVLGMTSPLKLAIYDLQHPLLGEDAKYSYDIFLKGFSYKANDLGHGITVKSGGGGADAGSVMSHYFQLPNNDMLLVSIKYGSGLEMIISDSNTYSAKERADAKDQLDNLKKINDLLIKPIADSELN